MIVCAALPLSAAAQDEGSLNSLEFIESSDFWLCSQNAAGLAGLGVGRTGMIELSGTKSDGSFVNYDESPDSYSFGGRSRSYVRLNPRTVLYGKVSYDYFRGKNMGGSAYVDPYFSSVNVMEYTDTTRGAKLKETYSLSGGVSYNFTDDFSIGFRADYDAADYAKTKDLRYVDDLMDLKVTAGVGWKIGAVRLGANCYFRRRVELAEFERVGTNDADYYSLVDYGGFFGEWELFGESGVTSTSFEAPELSTLQGGSLQAALRLGDFEWFNEFSLRGRSGYMGSTSTNRIVYFEHSGMEAGYRGGLTRRRSNSLNTLTLNLLYTSLQNNKNIYNIVTDNTVTTVNYYGSNLVGDRVSLKGGLEYAGYFCIKGNRPVVTFKAGADFYRLASRASSYPMYRDRDFNSIEGHISGTYDKIGEKGIFTVSAYLGYGDGFGNLKTDGIYDNPAAGATAVRSADFNLEREFEYFTSSRYRACLSLRYSHFLKNNMNLYGEISDRFVVAPNAVCLGHTANIAGIAVGLSF